MLVCANCPDAPGDLTQVAADGYCRRFRGKPKPVVRLTPPDPPDEKTKLISLTQGKFAMVDAADYECLGQYRWHAMKVGPNYYACRHGGGKTILMHRQIMQPSAGMVVDHKNHNSLDNCRENLRICTQQQNVCNRRPSPNESGFRGVRRHRKKWNAFIKCRGITYRLGDFDDPAEAARARDRKAVELVGEYAWLNFPSEIRGRVVCFKGVLRVRSGAAGRLRVIRRGGRSGNRAGRAAAGLKASGSGSQAAGRRRPGCR